MDLQQQQLSVSGIILKRKADDIISPDSLEGKMIKKNKHCRASKAKWTADEDEILTRAVVANGEGNWKKIAGSLSDRSHLQCLHRWQKVLNPALVKGPWKEEEDNKLVELVEKYGPKDWSTIAAHIAGRIGKQCRERWFNHLSPEVRKTNWSPEEDRIIIEAHHRLGNKWTAISKLLDGRPANAIKNHWNSTLLKRIQDSNGGMPPVRRERKNSKTIRPLTLSTSSLPMPDAAVTFAGIPHPLSLSTSSFTSSSSDEDNIDDDSDDEEDEELSSSSSSMTSSPEQPATPEDSSFQYLPPQFVPLSPHQKFLQELQIQQQLQQLANSNFAAAAAAAAAAAEASGGEEEAPASWDWNALPAPINVHTTGASVPVSLNSGFPTTPSFADKFVASDLEQFYPAQGFDVQSSIDLPLSFDVPSLDSSLDDDFSPVTVDGMGFLNLDMAGFCPLPLDM